MAKTSVFQSVSFDSSGLTGSFQNFGSVMAAPVYEMSIRNDSNVHVYISVDNSANTWQVADGDTLHLRARNKYNDNEEASILVDKGIQLKIKQVTGSGTGLIVANISQVV